MSISKIRLAECLLLIVAVLFVQVFLVVSISTSAIGALIAVAQHVEELPNILAQNLPDSANYFFSYLVLQGASVSSGTLLQVAGLVSRPSIIHSAEGVKS